MGVVFGFMVETRESYDDTRNRVQYQQSLRAVLSLMTREVRSAGVKLFDDGSGDIALAVAGVERLGFAALWPFARPWRFGQRTEPVLRAIPDAEAVADTLAEALHRYAGPAPASEPRAPDVAKSAAAA